MAGVPLLISHLGSPGQPDLDSHIISPRSERLIAHLPIYQGIFALFSERVRQSASPASESAGRPVPGSFSQKSANSWGSTLGRRG